MATGLKFLQSDESIVQPIKLSNINCPTGIHPALMLFHNLIYKNMHI